MHSCPVTTFARLVALTLLSLPALSADDEPAPGEARAMPAEDPGGAPAAEPEGDGPWSSTEPSEVPSPRRAQRLVYTCRDAAIPVFSDRPCGASMHAWRLTLPQSPAGGASPSTRAAPPIAATRPIVSAPPRRGPVEPPDPCARLTQQLAAIDARMRQGYSAREAARLWQRWRDAKAKLHAARCRSG